jgi:hypothetical protein
MAIATAPWKVFGRSEIDIKKVHTILSALGIHHYGFKLMNEGALSDNHDDIPKTIRDAMTVASNLGFHYL